MNLKTFRDINAVTETQYTIHNQNGDVIDFFTIDYLADHDRLFENINKAVKYEQMGAMVSVFTTMNDVLRVRCVVKK